MSQAMRPKLAALVGAASLAVSATGAAAGERTGGGRCGPARSTDAQPIEAQPTLDRLIRKRLAGAHAAGRRDEIEQLAGLWLTLARRGQLERVVAHGDGFINVALRNQRVSQQRAEARARRVGLLGDGALEPLAGATRDFVDEWLDVRRFVRSLGKRSGASVVAAMMGMNYREVGEVTGMSHAAARKWAERLRRRLAAASDGQAAGLPWLSD